MNYFFILLFSFSINGFSQNEGNIIKPRIKFTKLESKKRIKNELYYTISNNDTFYIEEYKFKSLNDFQYDKEKTPYLLEHFSTSVFFNTNKYSKKTYQLYQWKVPLVIYFDKAISNRIKKRVKTFYEITDSIHNLNITFTNNLDKANYRIFITDKTFDIDPYDFGITDSLEMQKFFFNNCYYSIVSDNSNGIIGCSMKINRKQLDSDDILLTNIKQGIFLSLGRFHYNYYLTSENSLTSLIYDNRDVLSNLDLNLLRLHYFQLYDRLVDGTDIFKLLQSNESNLYEINN
ncbi:hypothetical protein [Psychroserpens mesophilus]|uniref:hypothetical protein n=1 Tax=Psychroserpens mesophilus TaxID=325473 RepID=UPI003D64A37A